jgi:hypothetical protein
MSEEIEEVTVEQEDQLSESNGEESALNKEDSVDYWKSRARSWEKQAKENKDSAIAWNEYQESQKTVEEKRAQELEQLRNELESERMTRVRLEVASERGISGDAVALLTGSSREEVEAKAEALLALIESNTKPKSLQPDNQQGREGALAGSTADQFASALSDLI